MQGKFYKMNNKKSNVDKIQFIRDFATKEQTSKKITIRLNKDELEKLNKLKESLNLNSDSKVIKGLILSSYYELLK